MRTSQITDATRVLLLALADHMREDGQVSVPRQQVARAIGRSERRVAERVAAAIEKGYLTTVSPGYLGHTAVYRAILPEPMRAARQHPLARRMRVDPQHPLAVPPGSTHAERACVLPGSTPVVPSSPVRRLCIVRDRNAREDLRRLRGTA